MLWLRESSFHQKLHGDANLKSTGLVKNKVTSLGLCYVIFYCKTINKLIIYTL